MKYEVEIRMPLYLFCTVEAESLKDARKLFHSDPQLWVDEFASSINLEDIGYRLGQGKYFTAAFTALDEDAIKCEECGMYIEQGDWNFDEKECEPRCLNCGAFLDLPEGW